VEVGMSDSTSTDRLTLTVEEAARMLGLSRGSVYEAAHSGDIPTIRIGRRILVPRVALERMLERPGLEPASDTTTT